jgi:octaprenyl-diphosphate synthase
VVEQSLNYRETLPEILSGGVNERAGGQGARHGLLSHLAAIALHEGCDALAHSLLELSDLVAVDADRIEEQLATLPKLVGVVGKSAHHLLDLEGKRLRPLLVALASRVGSGFDHRAADLAVAVELVHSATLLHDDVVDLGDLRRGAPAARMIYGNAASIFAGDWLLVEALRRVRVSGVAGVLDRLLGTIEEMIAAESIQLARRGRVDADEAGYFRVIDGKTASLFRFATYAGACAGGIAGEALNGLESYGQHLGVAFQIVDDVLDLEDADSNAGKSPFADLREGKLTYPLIVGVERDPDLRAVLNEIVASPPAERDREVFARVVRSLRSVGAFDAARQEASRRCRAATRSLGSIPRGRARRLLEAIAEAVILRRR